MSQTIHQSPSPRSPTEQNPSTRRGSNRHPCSRCRSRRKRCQMTFGKPPCLECLAAGQEDSCTVLPREINTAFKISTPEDMERRSQVRTKTTGIQNTLHSAAGTGDESHDDTPSASSDCTTQHHETPNMSDDRHIRGDEIPNTSSNHHTQGSDVPYMNHPAPADNSSTSIPLIPINPTPASILPSTPVSIEQGHAYPIHGHEIPSMTANYYAQIHEAPRTNHPAPVGIEGASRRSDLVSPTLESYQPNSPSAGQNHVHRTQHHEMSGMTNYYQIQAHGGPYTNHFLPTDSGPSKPHEMSGTMNDYQTQGHGVPYTDYFVPADNIPISLDPTQPYEVSGTTYDYQTQGHIAQYANHPGNRPTDFGPTQPHEISDITNDDQNQGHRVAYTNYFANNNIPIGSPLTSMSPTQWTPELDPLLGNQAATSSVQNSFKITLYFSDASLVFGTLDILQEGTILYINTGLEQPRISLHEWLQYFAFRDQVFCAIKADAPYREVVKNYLESNGDYLHVM